MAAEDARLHTPRAPHPHRWRLLALASLALVLLLWACSASFAVVDVTEYALISRFGRVVRVIEEPGLYLKTPLDTVVRLDRRLTFSRPAQAEYLTVDKRNIVLETLATWRIA